MEEKLEEIEEKEDTIQATLNILVEAVHAIQVKLDMDPIRLAKSKKSKKARQ